MNQKLRCEPGAVLLLGILLFTLTIIEIAALLSAAAVHEAGHLIALLLARLPPTGVEFSLSGPVILYHQTDSKMKMLCSALSGPVAGLFFTCMIYRLWPICAEFSFLLSLINLLPVLPLDGGRALEAVLPNRFHFLIGILGFLIPVLFLLSGLSFVAERQNGSGLLMFGAWLLLLSCQETQFDVK